MVTLCSSQKSCFDVEVDEKVMFRFEVFGEVMCKVVAAYGAPVGANTYKTCVIMIEKVFGWNKISLRIDSGFESIANTQNFFFGVSMDQFPQT